jgi:plastocyanin
MNAQQRTHTTTVRRPVLPAIGLASLAAAAAMLLAGCGTPTNAASSTSTSNATTATTVETKLLSFQPQRLTVKTGTTVTWTVSDSIAHTVTTGSFTLSGEGLRTEEHPDGVLNKQLSSGHDVSFTFTKPGEYTYYCSIHKGMTGEVDVTA